MATCTMSTRSYPYPSVRAAFAQCPGSCCRQRRVDPDSGPLALLRMYRHRVPHLPDGHCRRCTLGHCTHVAGLLARTPSIPQPDPRRKLAAHASVFIGQRFNVPPPTLDTRPKSQSGRRRSATLACRTPATLAHRPSTLDHFAVNIGRAVALPHWPPVHRHWPPKVQDIGQSTNIHGAPIDGRRDNDQMDMSAGDPSGTNIPRGFQNLTSDNIT